MCLNDGTANRQPHTQTIRFAGKKSCEEFRYVFFGNTAPGIFHFHHNRTGIFTQCVDSYFMVSLGVLQSIEAITDKIQEDLLQLYLVATNKRKAAIKLYLSQIVPYGGVGSDERNSCCNNGIDIQRLHLRFTFL